MKNVNLKNLSKSLGFKNFYQITNKTNLNKKIKNFLDKKSLNFLEVRISNNKIKDLPRPKNLIQLKNVHEVDD